MGTIWPPSLTDVTGAKYLTLVHAIREAIAAGELAPGTRLPPVRNLAWDLNITPGTVARAYRRATDDGLLDASIGRGTYVAQTRKSRQADQRESLHFGSTGSKFDLRGSKTPDLGQEQMIRDALTKVSASSVFDYADYPDPEHGKDVLAAVAGWLHYTDMDVSPDNIAITYGAQHAMIIALQTILKGPTPVIITDELVFPGLRHAANMLRAELVSIERDADGMLPDAVEKACRKHGPQVLISSFNVHSPTAQTTTLERRVALARIAAKYELQIIDDDAFGIAATDIPSMQSIAPDWVWYIGALSKSVSTGLRIGYLVTPSGFGEAARTNVLSNHYGVSQIICDLATEIITSGAAERVRNDMIAFNDRRSKMAANILGKWHMNWNPHVPFIWLYMPQGWRASSFQRACEQKNVLIRPADEFALMNGKAPNAARVTFGAKLSDAQFEDALKTIAGILESRPETGETYGQLP